MKTHKHVAILLWPFYAIWWLLSTILEFTGRLVAAILGVVFMIVGLVVSLTIVGAVVGIPLAILGFMLTIRALF
jgi:hypothetical protein